MNSVMDTSGKPKSRNLSVNWYDMKFREKERQMAQFIGISQFQSSESKSEVMEGTIALTEIGSTSSGKDATRQDSSIVRILTTNYCTFEPFKDTQEEKIFHKRCWATSSFLTSWKEFVFHRGCSFILTSIFNAGLIVGGREGRETRHTVFFTPSNHEVPKKKNIVMSSRSPEKFTTKQVGSTFKMLFIGSILGGHRRKA